MLIRKKVKEKVVYEELHDEHNEFIIDFASAIDPVAAMKKVLHALAIHLKKLASIRPQNPEIQ